MNILFIYYYPNGGIETLNRHRNKALQKHGIHCHFLYYRHGPGLQNNEDNTQIFITDQDNEIRRIVLNGNYQAIVVCSDHSRLQQLRQAGYRGKIIYEVQGLGTTEDTEGWLKRAHGIITAYSDAILFPQTPHLKTLIEKYYPTKRKFSFHNCIDTATFHYKALPKEGGPIIGWVGRLEKNKNWREFLSIASRLLNYNRAIRLWVFEDPNIVLQSERQAFYKRVKALRLQDHLKVHSNVSNRKMAEYYSMIGDSGGFLCSTSITEGFGYALIEAMCCRCPVLTTDSDGVKSFIIHNVTGKFYNPEKSGSAENQAIKLLTHGPLREKIKVKALAHVSAHFTPDAYAKNFIGMLTTLGLTL